MTVWGEVQLVTDRTEAFFEGIVRATNTLLDRLPLRREPAQMKYIASVIQPAARAERERSTFENPSPELIAQLIEHDGVSSDSLAGEGIIGKGPPGGLNTVGMLLDRLSILSIKHWNLVHRSLSPEKAEALRTSQIRGMIDALASARPGDSSTNNKMSVHQVDVRAADFREACFGLVSTNLLIWESQEILYNHNIQALPCSELRLYISFFSSQNLARNVFIEASERLYWSSLRSGK